MQPSVFWWCFQADQALSVLPEAFVILSGSVGGSVLASHPKSQDPLISFIEMCFCLLMETALNDLCKQIKYEKVHTL